ncbi:efflux transporter, outer membrane factor (OMF) lipo, NodT family protein, partial [Vibrio parahaemolyticus VP-48]
RRLAGTNGETIP